MFVRKKVNKSGSISVQVISKIKGKSKLIKTIGSSKDEDTIKEFVCKAKEFINTYKGQQQLDFANNISSIKTTYNKITKHIEIGTELLLGDIYNNIGFNQLQDDIFKNLVFARLVYPVSKLKTSDYLTKYKDIDIPVQQIYRYLDKLYKEQKEQIQQISYKHTLTVLKGGISVVFYDVTTLYFQIDDEDDLRKRGFSKEGKHQNPQILLGLLVSVDGYPLAYEIFEGNKFEGHTMLPVIDRFKDKYNIDKLIIIADSGLLSSQNITELQEKGYEFILGARIKNEKQDIKDKILSLNLKNGKNQIIEKENGLKIIISYSNKRARKDKNNRERGLKRLQKQLKSGKLTKSHINNRGYNKYLKMEGDIDIKIDMEKFNQDAEWDGLKGYITNTDLTKDQIIENYGHLWKIEKAFRISKHDLKIRPIYHQLQRRIEAHITINFVAYKIYKELERLLKEKKADISPEKAIDIAKTIYAVKINVPFTKETRMKTLLLNEEQEYIVNLFNLKN